MPDSEPLAGRPIASTPTPTGHVSTRHMPKMMLPDESRHFETYVIGGPLDGRLWRYHTEEQAAAGHHLVAQLAATVVR